MPCYQINLVTLKFKAQNVDLIMKVLEDMKLRPKYDEKRKVIYTSLGEFNLNTGEVETPSYYAKKVNDFRVNYSMEVLKVAAKKNKWVVKQRATRQFVAKKW